VDASQRKADKARAWLPADRTDLPLSAWVAQAVALTGGDRTRADVVTQNTIHRLTGTTGTGPFAPRQVERTVYPVGQRLVVYAVLDTDRLALAAFEQALQDIGANGYGRDASTGLGKFRLVEVVAHRWSEPADAGHMLTLAPCAPDPAQVDAADSHYQPLTRFGRHGSLHALGGQPFKKPVLLMRSAAVLALQPRSDDTRRTAPLFHGRGLGGVGDPVSMVQPATVHQGYAPVLPLALPAATTSHVQSTARTA
jgi:CRISPR-associated protein Csm4